MKAFLHTIFRITVYMNVIAGIALTFIILLTVCDVLLRALGKPILGAYEIVAMAGGIVIGFVTPLTSWVRGHIFMDFVIEKFSRRAKSAFRRCREHKVARGRVGASGRRQRCRADRRFNRPPRRPRRSPGSASTPG